MPKFSPSLLTARLPSRVTQTQTVQIQTVQTRRIRPVLRRPMLLGLGAALGCCALNSCALGYRAASPAAIPVVATASSSATIPGSATAPSSGAGPNVRVLVVAAPQLTVRVPVQATPQRDAFTPAPLLSPPASGPMTDWRVGVSGGQLTLNGRSAGNTTLYLPPTPGSVVEIAGKPYRGGVLLRVQDGGVQGVNVVNIEDYLRGVVPAEMPASWPAAALAAQAVVARTYVAARINPAAPYDTCATDSCQVYPGLRAEKAQTSAAIQATRSQVVAYAGKPASTYFSSDSGGFTASSAEVWGKALPYLRAQADPYSASGPRAGWRVEIAATQVQTVAARYGAKVGSLRAVTITRLSVSGRPEEITVSGSDGVARITGAKAGGFVRSLGAPGTRVKLSGLNPLVISGSGAGHGVGLSQYGALGLAKAGQDHLRILGFYYPGTSLSALSGPTGSGPAGSSPVGSGSAASVQFGGVALMAGGFQLPSSAPADLKRAVASSGALQ
ncbi:SpoIID/LytB domain-containing protein [Deinococcus arenicola]|uniref:SpoIID/LytB domain-containing protein n=1 Tax=Deinococcus arenicola TaxID=2994950 RepID=A0ABU4DT82_9DEIO|nr:SpoIID/LytB domain-containing protein [Deinococcus sp. ZS9-10]MDV6375642.1 SpoIID/LytB domain-containing protein [Deinococcus sp. ZS9-10]